MSVITSRITYLTISILLLVVVCLTAVGKAEELTQDTTWSGTHVLEDTVVVPAGIVLNIEPGTVVMMKDAAALIVNGQLLAEGTESEPQIPSKELQPVRPVPITTRHNSDRFLQPRT